ncbi:NIF system FeS cluster assembly, NifU, N-terminal [Sesbania bispinosa]|nr:NIF system FeS cluster assembly, NifU, N-terminal [Sesbania bispinosa]
MLRFAASVKRLVGTASAPSPAVTVLPRLYHERVVDHYNNPRNVGSFDKNDPTVGTGLVGAPACGDVMKLQIKVDENTGKIVDARFKTFGCGSAIASSSVATEWVKGKQMEEVLSIKNTWVQSCYAIENIESS